MIIAFIIWSLIAILFVIFGVSARKSKEAVGFFSGVKPPEVKDVKAYNYAVSRLWFIFASFYEILGIKNTPCSFGRMYGRIQVFKL